MPVAQSHFLSCPHCLTTSDFLPRPSPSRLGNGTGLRNPVGFSGNLVRVMFKHSCSRHATADTAKIPTHQNIVCPSLNSLCPSCFYTPSTTAALNPEEMPHGDRLESNLLSAVIECPSLASFPPLTNTLSRVATHSSSPIPTYMHAPICMVLSAIIIHAFRSHVKSNRKPWVAPTHFFLVTSCPIPPSVLWRVSGCYSLVFVPFPKLPLPLQSPAC